MSSAERSANGPVALIHVAAAPESLQSAKPAACHCSAGRSLLGWVASAAREAGCEHLCVIAAKGTLSDDQQDLLASEPELAGAEWLIAPDESSVCAVVADALAARGPSLDQLYVVLSAEAPCLEADLLGRLIEAARRGGDPVVCTGPEVGDAVVVLGSSYLNDVLASSTTPATPAVTATATPSTGSFEIDTDELDQLTRVADRSALAQVQARLRRRVLDRILAEGVTMIDPARVVVDAGVRVAADVILHPDVSLLAGTVVGRGCELHQGAWLRACELGENVTVHPYSVLDGARVSDGCQVGPFARLRPGTVLGEGARIGNFVEVKASTLGEGSKANHLAYIGDAQVGKGVNIGAGAVTCNYDGADKHRTEIADDAFVGSDTMLIAPVRVGRGALTAAGSVIHMDVPDGALAVGRARQRNVEGWAARKGPQVKKRAREKDKGGGS